jgi:signal transduction histidine kinase
MAERLITWCVVWLVALAMTIGLVLPGRNWRSAILVGVGLAVFVAPMMLWSWRSTWWSMDRPFVAIPVRVIGAVVGATGFLSGPVPPALAGLLAGLVIGCDAALTLRGVGIRVTPLRAIRYFAVSGLHVGAVLGLVVVVAFDDASGLWPYIDRYGLLWLAILTMLATLGGFQNLERMAAEERSVIETSARLNEHRERAHWIHDDVCSELRFVRIQVEQDALDGSAVSAALDELDHRLRLRQLDELLETGVVRVADVVQPFVRTMQDRGIRISDVPRFDEANMLLKEKPAKLLRRSLSVLVSNGLQAGAGEMGIRCLVQPPHLVVEVEDDAGGFDLDSTPQGRGLDSLRSELGGGGLWVTRTARGSVVSARLIGAVS